VVAGKGNNGGDGLVIARHLKRQRVRCEVFLAGRAGEATGDGALNLRRWRRAGGRVREIDVAGLPALAAALTGCGVVVDALYGTGLRGPLSERAVAIVETMNAAAVPILAVDIPSGLDADRGVPLGAAVQATATATFAFPKVGLLLHPGADHAGEVAVVDIGIAAEALDAVKPKQFLLTKEAVPAALPPRAPDSHKGSFGHVLVIAGSRGKSGAALMAARAALRAGAGLVTVAAPASVLSGIVLHTPELMSETVPEHDGAVAFSSAESAAFLRLLDSKDAVVFGPGVTTAPGARALTEWLISSCPLPMIIDADGLNCLAGQIGWLRRKQAPIILTPHPGEMARLAGRSRDEVQSDRIASARSLAVDYGVAVVLKGARTVIAGPDGMASINPTGNPGMASGGMGDALAGIIGSLLAQGLEAREAGEVAAYWHAYAADRVAARRGEAGLLASDVIEELPPALHELQELLYGRDDR
jgi:NAD(P)H-hydrate epimerase